MSSKKKVFRQATLSSNCPECYNTNTLLLTLFQEENDTPWYYQLSDHCSETLVCKKCETTIYPVRYTKDIERVKAFYKRSMGIPPKAFRLKPLTFVALALLIAAVATTLLIARQPELFTSLP